MSDRSPVMPCVMIEGRTQQFSYRKIYKPFVNSISSILMAISMINYTYWNYWDGLQTKISAYRRSFSTQTRTLKLNSWTLNSISFPNLYTQSISPQRTNRLQKMSYFNLKVDRFNGITTDSDSISFSSDHDFEEKLTKSLEQWKKSGYRAAWIKTFTKHSSLVPICIKLGFDFHHAQPGYVMLNQWLSETEANGLPEYANQYIGVAGFVVNKKQQLLVIKERFSKGHAHWKLPGGHAEKEEEIPETAIRETLEETGVNCTFESLLAFRHQHNYQFGCSDLYFICALQPITEEIKPCLQEVAQCKWINLDEFINDPDVSDANRTFAQSYKQQLAKNMTIKPTKVLSYNKKAEHNIYSIQTFKN